MLFRSHISGNEKRYRYDTGSIIDQKTGDILSERQAVNRLNRQDILIETKKEQIKFHVEGYNQLKQTIEEAYKNERTALGRSVLKQLLETIQ